jgi:hypothetical protein
MRKVMTVGAYAHAFNTKYLSDLESIGGKRSKSCLCEISQTAETSLQLAKATSVNILLYIFDSLICNKYEGER